MSVIKGDKIETRSAASPQPSAPEVARKPDIAPAVMWVLTERFDKDEGWAESIAYRGVANADGYMLLRNTSKYVDGANEYDYYRWSDEHKQAYASVRPLLDEYFGYWGGPEPEGTRETLQEFSGRVADVFSAAEVTSGSIKYMHVPPGEFRDIELIVRVYG